MKTFEKRMRFTIAVMVIVIFSYLVFVSQAYAGGPFLDLDIGASLTNYQKLQPDGTPYLGNENPMLILRAGYQTDTYNMFGPVDVRVHSYYEHMSSAGDTHDTGFDVLMFGFRFE